MFDYRIVVAQNYSKTLAGGGTFAEDNKVVLCDWSLLPQGLPTLVPGDLLHGKLMRYASRSISFTLVVSSYIKLKI